MTSGAIKVVQINSVYKIGSTGKIVYDLSHELYNQGDSCFILYGRNGDINSDHVFKVSSEIDNRIHGILTRIADLHGFCSIKATLKLINKIIEYSPDIIHLHNLHGYYLNIKILFKFLEKYDIPVVWTLHDCWSMTGHCAHFNFVGCNKWKTGCYNCILKKRYPASLLKDNSKQNYLRKKNLFTSVKDMNIVVPSIWLKSIVHESFLNNYPCKVIYNGIDLEVFKQRINDSLIDKYKLKNKFIILGVANIWDENKGLNDFIKLSKLLNSGEVVILIGLNDTQIINLPKNIIGIKRTDNIKELVELYSIANVYINPSKEETFGFTTIEAMACGTPVIVYNTTASPELINEKCGYIVETGRIKGLLDAITAIKERGKVYYSQNCRNHVVNNFNKIDKYKEYIDLYKSLIK